jgi:hypothetical protein
MAELKLQVPTYNGNRFPEDVEAGRIKEYGEPLVPVAIYEEAGLRVVMGTHEYDNDPRKPDIVIERQPAAWAIFLHPDAGDESAYLYIHDNGHTYLVPEHYYPSVPPFSVVDRLRDIPGLCAPADDLPPNQRAGNRARFTARLMPRSMREMGVIGSAIAEALREIHRISAHEKLDPLAMERIVDKHVTRLSRPTKPPKD